MREISSCSIVNTLSIAYTYLDYIPVVSTLTSLINIFQKYIVIPLFKPSMEKSRYYKHIQDKKREQESQRASFKAAILGNENKTLSPKKIKQRPNQETHPVVLTEANLAQYEMAEEMSQITGIDEALFQSLNRDSLYALLKRCPNVLIEITFKEVPYYIPASTLLSISFFDRMLFGQFQESDGLTCTSHQLQFKYPSCQETQANVPLYLEALEVAHVESFQAWSLLSLIRAYLGADYSLDQKIQKELLHAIAVRAITSDEELGYTIEFMLFIGASPFDAHLDDLQEQKIQLFHKCLQYDLLASNAPVRDYFYTEYAERLESLDFTQKWDAHSLLKIDAKRLCQITHSLPNLNQLIVQEVYDLKLKGLEGVFTEKLVEITLYDIPFTRQQLIDIGMIPNMTKQSASLTFSHIFFSDLPRSLQANRHFIISAICRDDPTARRAVAWAYIDPSIILQAVQQDGLALRLAAANLRNNRDIVLAAVRQNGLAFEYASEDLRNDPDVVLAAVQQNDLVFKFARAGLRNNRDIVLAAVQQNGLNLRLAGSDLRNNRDIVLAAVQQNGLALRLAGSDLRSNHDIVLAAVQQNGLALEFAGEALRNDPGIVLIVVRQNGLALKHASETCRNNPAILLEAIGQNGLALEFTSVVFKNDPNIVLKAVQQNGFALKYASVSCQNSPEIVFEAVKQNRKAFQYASRECQDNSKILHKD